MRRPVPSSMSNPFAARPPKHARHAQQPEPTPEVSTQVEQPEPQEVDKDPAAHIQSGFSIFNLTPVKDTTMSDKDAEKVTTTRMTAEERAAAKAEREAAREAKKQEAEAAKMAKAAEREAKKLEAEAAKVARAEARAAAKAEREARAAELGDKAKMAALRDAKKNYVKSATGQLRSNDDLAVALDAVQPTAVIAIALRLLQLDVNPYERLNVGQQSMNLRNKLRGAIKRNVLTIADVAARRDAYAATAVLEAA